MTSQDLEHPLAVLQAEAGGKRDAEDSARTVIVLLRMEDELAVPPVVLRLDGPAGEAASHLLYVSLGVTTVHAERVQLHQFPAVVLIERGPGTAGIIQVVKHRRAL